MLKGLDIQSKIGSKDSICKVINLEWILCFHEFLFARNGSGTTCWESTHLIPLSFLIDGHEAISLSCSSDSPNERVNNVEAAHSDPKDRILSDEAYPEERSHGQSLDELKARFDIGNLHHQPYSLRW